MSCMTWAWISMTTSFPSTSQASENNSDLNPLPSSLMSCSSSSLRSAVNSTVGGSSPTMSNHAGVQLFISSSNKNTKRSRSCARVRGTGTSLACTLVRTRSSTNRWSTPPSTKFCIALRISVSSRCVMIQSRLLDNGYDERTMVWETFPITVLNISEH